VPFAVAAEQPGSISAGEAAAYVGQTKTVCGVVASSKFAQNSNGEPTFLNLDRAYPNQIFTAVIWGTDRGKFKESPEVAFQGKRTCITGPIQLYQNVPEVTVTSPSQLRVGSAGQEGRRGSDASASHPLTVSPGAPPVVGLPEHAHLSPLFGNRWQCDQGYRQVAGRCETLAVPANAHVSPLFGDRWQCDQGYRQVGEKCDQVVVPAHAHIVPLFGDRWQCDLGYKLAGDACIPMSPNDQAQQPRLPAGGGGSGHSYDVSGNGDNGYVYGNVDAERGSRDVDGYIYDEDGNEHHISGEWSGKGQISVDDDEGNHYDLDTD
jgi:hypothetical protein